MSVAGFSCWDIFFAVLGVYFVVRGLFRGLVGEVIALVGFLASFYCAFRFSGQFGRFIEGTAGINPYAAQAVAGVVIWLTITMAASVVRMVMKGLIRAASLGGIDKLLGLFAGALKTIIVIYAIMAAGILLAPVANPTWMSDSDVLRYAGRSWPQFRSALIGLSLVPRDTALPEGTLEEILRPYREGGEWPYGYDYHNDENSGGGETDGLSPAGEVFPSQDGGASGV